MFRHNARLMLAVFVSSLGLIACGLFSPPVAELTLQEAADIVAEDADGPGIVLALRVGDEPQQIVASGLANTDAGTPVQTNDSFRIGSMTKTFLGVLILQLAEDNLIDIDDTASDYLGPEALSGIDNAEEATIQELLNMSSGIYDYLENEDFWEQHYRNPTYFWQPLDTLAYAQGEPANFAPGTGWSYSNTNYILLQLIAEEATGQPLGALFEQRILAPTGMNDSYLEHYKSGPLVSSYEYLEDVTGYNDGTGMGDGGLISTAADLDLFLRALEAGYLLNDPSLDAFFEPTGRSGDAAEYGLGVELINTSWGEAWGHTGSTAGFSSEFWYLPEADATVIMLRNAIDDVDTLVATDTAFALAVE